MRSSRFPSPAGTRCTPCTPSAGPWTTSPTSATRAAPIAPISAERSTAGVVTSRSATSRAASRPQDDLRKFGVTTDDLQAGRYTEPFVHLMRHQAERARRYYRAAQESFPTVDARSLVPAEIMGRIYRALLEEIEVRGFRVFG